MIIKACAHALEWWVGQQGYTGPKNIRTCQLDNGTFEVFEWSVGTIPKPTDAEVNQIVADWEAQYVPPSKKKDFLDMLKDSDIKQAIKDIKNT